jgi:hypothetical protein
MSSKGSASQQAKPGSSLSIALLASTVGGGVEPLISYPFEFIKTSQQLQSRTSAPAATATATATPNAVDAKARGAIGSSKISGRVGFFSVASNVWQKDGLKGFYHGVGVVAVGGAAKVSHLKR